MKIKLNKEMEEIVNFFKEIKEIYFVGGCVRDILLNIEPHDYDLITNLEPNDVIDYIKSKGRRAYQTGKRFGTVGVKLNNVIVEVTTYRKEIYDFQSRKPCVKFSNNLHDDLNRRDFTINSIIADKQGNIKDPNNGMEDLNNKILRTVGIPKLRFKEDPLRILRAIRFTVKYDLDIEENTYKKLCRCRWELYRISKERIIDEINKIFMLNLHNCVKGIDLLMQSNIFQIIIPELHLQKDYDQNSPYHQFKLWQHTLNVIKNLKEQDYNYQGLWVGLLHDIGKPFVKEPNKKGYYNYISHDVLGADLANDICIKNKFSNKDREFIVTSIKEHLNEDSWLKIYDGAAK